MLKPRRYHHPVMPLVIWLSLLLSFCQASESSNNPYNPPQPDITTFAFTRASNDDENDKIEPQNQQQPPETEESESSVYSSSLLYEGGCVVSAEAIMCTGGDFSFYPQQAFDEEDEDESSDDEDDDDNDGHSSMLSNASLRRSKVGAGGCPQHQRQAQQPKQQQEADMVAKAPPSQYKFQSIAFVSTPTKRLKALSLRGGALGLGLEFARTLLVTALVTSNASLRRSKGGSCIRHYRPHIPRQQQQPTGELVSKPPRPNQYQLQSMASISATTNQQTTNQRRKALSVRGGASDLGVEFAKKLFVTALVTLVFEFMIGHVLEFVKISMQTSPDGTSYTSVLKAITASKGLAGLWDGFCPWGIIQAIFKGSVFGLAHAMASSVLVPLAQQSGSMLSVPVAKTIAGGIGGGFQGLVLSPTLLLKTRVMTNPIFREKMSLAQTTWWSAKIGADVVATEGFGALMKGAGVFSTKRVCDWASRYYFSDLLEQALARHRKGSSLSVQDKMVCSLLGGTASTFVTLPLDVLVAKIQDAKKAGVSVSAWKLFRDELAEKGWSGLKNSYMKGFEARLLHVALTTVAVKTGTPIVYDLLFPSSKQQAAA